MNPDQSRTAVPFWKTEIMICRWIRLVEKPGGHSEYKNFESFIVSISYKCKEYEIRARSSQDSHCVLISVVNGVWSWEGAPLGVLALPTSNFSHALTIQSANRQTHQLLLTFTDSSRQLQATSAKQQCGQS